MNNMIETPLMGRWNRDLTPAELLSHLQSVRSGGCNVDGPRSERIAPVINRINRLKKEKRAVILAHSYVSSEIVYGVADHSGDSYQLSKDAMTADADTIVFAAVRFMAETAKILNPGKKVLVPSRPDGCTLADSITAEQVRRLRADHPDHAFLCYVNTSAAVKAECDVTVTSSNVFTIAERVPNDKIFFLPDRLMGLNLRAELERRGVQKEVLFSDGSCYVHETYDPFTVMDMRQKHPGLEVLAHPECNPGVARAADFIGSTGELMKRVKASAAPAFLLLTECGLANRLEVEAPGKKFVGSCSLCRYMKANRLEDVERVLVAPTADDEVTLDEEVRLRALRSLEAMFHYVEGSGGRP